MSYLERIQAKAATKAVEHALPKAPKAPFDPFGSDANGHDAVLAPDLTRGLKTLRAMNPPQLSMPAAWGRVVADACRLVDGGWADHALALGWSPLDLWGCSPDIGGNPDHDGLVVWIDGRRVLLLDERTCIVATSATLRSVFSRRDVAGAVLLWEMGRG